MARSQLLPQAALQAYEREQRFNLHALVGGPSPARRSTPDPSRSFRPRPGFFRPRA